MCRAIGHPVCRAIGHPRCIAQGSSRLMQRQDPQAVACLESDAGFSARHPHQTSPEENSQHVFVKNSHVLHCTVPSKWSIVPAQFKIHFSPHMLHYPQVPHGVPHSQCGTRHAHLWAVCMQPVTCFLLIVLRMARLRCVS